MGEPFQPDRFPRANLQPAAEQRSAGVICLLYTIRISFGILILLCLNCVLLISFASTKYIPFYWLKVGAAGTLISCCLTGVLLYWEQKLSQVTILERWNIAQQRLRSWATDGWRARSGRNRRPNPQDNPVPVQDESIMVERRVGPLIVPQRMEDSIQPIHRLGREARQLEGTSVTAVPREGLQPSSTSEPEGGRHGQSMPTELTMITPLQQAMDELAATPIRSELAQRVGIPLVQRTRRVTGGERPDLQTSNVQQLANQERIPQIPGAVDEPEGSEDPVQGPAEGRCPLADLNDI